MTVDKYRHRYKGVFDFLKKLAKIIRTHMETKAKDKFL